MGDCKNYKYEEIKTIMMKDTATVIANHYTRPQLISMCATIYDGAKPPSSFSKVQLVKHIRMYFTSMERASAFSNL